MNYLAGILFILLLAVGGVGNWYYNDTQARIATLRENNAKLEVAISTAEDSMNLMKEEMAKNQELMNQLSTKLQKAEKYGDDLRNKLRQLDLVQKAIKDPEELQGKMNGATAKLWREIMADTGSTDNHPFPDWLQQYEPSGIQFESSGERTNSSNKNREDGNSDSLSTETSKSD
mgnify:CR=1 FL=1